ncbi:MAG: cobalamin-independent methionine synthase II family protein [Gammaproteobacteria bacterium]
MRRSTDRILCTHGGNLPRPAGLDALLVYADENRAALSGELPLAVKDVVERQIACGIDVVNDGEYVKAANMGHYVTYIQPRITGFAIVDRDPSIAPKRGGVAERDRREFPGYHASGLWYAGSGGPVRPGFSTPGTVPKMPLREQVCTEPLKYIGQEAIATDVAALKEGIRGRDVEGFIAALGPLSLGAGVRNKHYRNEEEYMMAVARTVREEYKAITDAGLILQIDEPEFATTWMFYPDWTVRDYRSYLEFAVEVINHAIDGLPEDRIRFHMCWGSGHRPHANDIELKHIVDLLFRINAQAYSFEASNARHAHEWRVFEKVKPPPGKIIVPGVVGHSSDLIEHPELVAERLVNFAKLVGMENLQASTDCGIGSRVGHAEVAWAKLKSISAGAAIATDILKGK